MYTTHHSRSRILHELEPPQFLSPADNTSATSKLVSTWREATVSEPSRLILYLNYLGVFWKGIALQFKVHFSLMFTSNFPVLHRDLLNCRTSGLFEMAHFRCEFCLSIYLQAE